MCVTAVNLKHLRVLLQQVNRQCGDGQHMECEVLKGNGQSVEDSSGDSDTEPKDCTV